MPNIALTTYCNLHCPYCFADEMISSSEVKNITLAQLNDMLRWINQSHYCDNRIGLIGGEPTLHPYFLEILSVINNFCTKNKFGSILFTNGIYIGDYLDDIPKKMILLVNVNTPSAMTPDQWQKLNENLDKMYSLGWMPKKNHKESFHKVTLGCNLCPQIDDYSFFWYFVKRYQVGVIRMSVTAPTKPEHLADKEGYYKLMYPKFIEFLQTAKKHHVKINYDCNQIPQCYLSKEENELRNELSFNDNEKKSRICSPVIDITPDFKASSCFGTYKIVDCKDFSDLDELHRYFFYTQNVPKTLVNTQGRCATCPRHERIQCQGGCLAFADMDKKGE